MFKCNRATYIFFIIITLFCSTLSLALVWSRSEGTWPSDWPAQLEPYRRQATTLEIATGEQENVYDIHFDEREQFENIWPTILKLKSKGAPLLLCSIEQPFKKGTLFNNEKPTVRIYAPVYPVSESFRPGGKKLQTGPPWPDSIMSPSGELPEYVTISQDGMTWVPVKEEKPPIGFKYRARIEIELVVDGKIIDLNRIRFPSETPIIDRRKLEKQDQQSKGEEMNDL